MSKSMMKNCVIGLIGGIVNFIVLTLVFSFICNSQVEPEKYFTLFSYIILSFSSFAGGYLSTRLNKEKGLLCGLIVGILYTLVLIIFSVFLKEENEKWNYLNMGISLCLPCIGGVIGLPKQRVKRRKRNSIKQ